MQNLIAKWGQSINLPFCAERCKFAYRTWVGVDLNNIYHIGLLVTKKITLSNGQQKKHSKAFSGSFCSKRVNY